jgi:hypothetical protein
MWPTTARFFRRPVVVFWLWFGIVVLAVPPIAIGLALAMIFLYLQVNYPGTLRHYFNTDKRLDSAANPRLKPLRRDRNHFQRIWEWFMDAGLENNPPRDYRSLNRRTIVVVMGLLLASACTVLGAYKGYKGIEALVWFLMLFALVVVSCVGLVPFMMLCVRHLLRILRKFPRDGARSVPDYY